jgi:hypothetical protein
MRSSAACEIGSAAWHEASLREEREWLEEECRRGNCRGQWTDSHGARGERMRRLYPAIDENERMLLSLANKCGPACK